MASSPFPFTLNGTQYVETDFHPYTYATSLGRALKDFSTEAAAAATSITQAQSLAATMAAGPVANVQRRGRSLTGIVSPRPLDASPILSTKGQLYEPGITLDATFARTTAASYIDAAGIIRYVAAGAPRFDSNPVTGEYLGMLIEPQRGNSYTFSEEFDNAAWGKVNATITANATVSPDGLITADKFVAASGATGYISRNITVAAATAYALSIFAKAAEDTQFTFLLTNVPFGGTGGNRTIVFDLVAGTFVVAGVTGTEMSGAIQKFPNGWFRCTAVVVPSVAGTLSPQAVRSTTVGDGVKGVFIWGAQFELSTASSYIQTGSTTVTRPTDSIIIPTGDWFNKREGTFFYEFQSQGAQNATQYVGGMAVGALANNADAIYTVITTTGNIQSIVRTGNVSVATLQTNGITRANLNRLAFAYGPNDLAASFNGLAPVTSTAGSIAQNMDRWVLGHPPWVIGSSPLTGGMTEARYIPRRLPNATLQRMTS